MFFVLNKEKVCAYIVSIITVCFLFFIASATTENAIETSTNTIENNEIITNNIKFNNNISMNNIVK